MCEAGIVETPTDFNPPYVAPTIFIDKKLPPPVKIGSFRVVHDYRDVNAATMPPGYPCHNLETDRDSVYCGNPRVHSQADASNGFWGIGVYPPDRHKTAFSGPNTMYWYTAMAQGLTGSPSTYARFGDTVFGPHDFPDGTSEPALLGYHDALKTSFSVYVDDHNMASETFDQHYIFLRDHYFPRVAWAPIGLSAKKTRLFFDEIESLGFSLRDGCIRPGRRHREKFAEFGRHFQQHPPDSWESVQRLLYLTPFVRRFIPGRADLVRTIKDAFFERLPKNTARGKTSLVCSEVLRDVPQWSQNAQLALETICRSVQENATFGAREGAQFHIATDSSDEATGGVLFQMSEGIPEGTACEDGNFKHARIIMWLSQRFNDAERRYSMPEKEMLAVVRALKECDWLISTSPHPIIVYTDHKGITDSMANKDHVHGKVARWADILFEYPIRYVHHRNTTKIMGIADGMSRLPDELRTESPVIKRRSDLGELMQQDSPVAIVNAIQWARRYQDPWKRKSQGNANMLHSGGLTGEKLLCNTVDGLGAMEELASSEWYGEVVSCLVLGAESLPQDRRRLVRRKCVHYRLHGNSLYYLETDESLAECVLPERVPVVLQKAHDGKGHFAPPILMRKLRGMYFWPTRIKDVEIYYRSCIVCQQTAPRIPRTPPRSVYALDTWDLMGMDFLGPITPAAKSGATYVLLSADYMSKYLLARATVRADGQAVVDTWEDKWAPLVGWPKKIYCDNGSHFSNLEFTATCEKHGTKLSHGPVSHPQSTGLMERYVRMVKNQMMKWAVERDGTNLEYWDEALPQILASLNNRYVAGLGTSPAMVVLGREVFVQHCEELDDVSLCAETENVNSESADAMRSVTLFDIDKRQELRRRIVERNAVVCEQRNKNNFRPVKFRVGSRVWEKQDKGSKLKGKFHKSWANLSEIIKILSPVTYLTKSLKGSQQMRKIHVDDLKPYVPRPERLKPPRLVTWDMADIPQHESQHDENQHTMEDVFEAS